MNNSICSIIIPNYNSAKFIKKTINSIINQNYKSWEAIIVDDGSTDNSPKIIEEYSKNDNRIKYFKRNRPNKGAAVCRNIGIEKSTGDYIIFLDSDDLLAPFCLKQREALMRQNSTLDFAVFPMEVFHNKPKDSNHVVNKYTADGDYLTMFLQYDLPWAITCPIWKTSFLKKNNIRFDERYQRLQDPEFHTKILLNHEPKFNVIKYAKSDCFYQLRPQKLIYNEHSLNSMISGLMLYVADIKKMGRDSEMPSFFSKTIHALLFYYKQRKFSLIKKFVQSFSKKEQTISLKVIYLFFLFNKMGFTFKKGFGISRFWNFVNSIKQ